MKQNYQEMMENVATIQNSSENDSRIYYFLLNSLEREDEEQHHPKTPDQKLDDFFAKEQNPFINKEPDWQDFKKVKLFDKGYVQMGDFDIKWVLTQIQEEYGQDVLSNFQNISLWEEFSNQEKMDIETEYWKGVSKRILKIAQYIVSSQKIKHNFLESLESTDMNRSH